MRVGLFYVVACMYYNACNNITYLSKSMKLGGTVVNKKTTSPEKFKNTQSLGISELDIENNKSSFVGQATLPKKGHQVDNYEGPIDPITRLRHGVGTYRYPNKFFTYKGNYNQGIKQGQGTLTLADGTVINGTFSNNQLIGEAQINYPDGSFYKGILKNGEKSGYGVYQSKLQSYQGEYLQNKKHGQGTYKTRTTTIAGPFQNNKPHGPGVKITKYNYQYNGQCSKGLKNGKGLEVSTYLDNNYRYEGRFVNDKFAGEGLYVNNSKIGYKYEGEFKNGLPALYPNEFRILLGTSTSPEGQRPSIQNYANITSQQSLTIPIQYQLQLQNKLYFAIQSCYQAPQQLDPNQPTEQQIQKMIKDWQNENKKNKNPPPMPDFRQPRMIKPQLVIVQQESLRPIQIRLGKIEGNEAGAFMKVDYRENIKKAREKNEQIKAENAKKAQQQGNKKGGKAPNKGGQVQLKVNCFSEPTKQEQKYIQITNEKGKAQLNQIQFPDDFPPGSYQFIFSSPFTQFGEIKPIKKAINIKSKNVGGKKK